jgi:hypothetical protein
LLGRADQARHDSWRRLVQDRHPDLRRVALDRHLFKGDVCDLFAVDTTMGRSRQRRNSRR